MIVLDSKLNCCGCTACSQVCPKQCITMKMDEEGFKYPIVDAEQCVDCGLCEKVCPYLNSYRIPKEKPASYACKTKDDDLRERSSSGGLFTVVATKVIKDGGVVFGAKFDSEWNVVHGFTEILEGLADFRGSKYAQSDLGDSFKRVKDFLKAGRIVMFTGTPCQIAGLNHFLQKSYENLITVDLICHSVPSPKVWSSYLKEIENNDKVVSVTFKDKSEGWAKYGLFIKGENGILDKGNHLENIYMKAFLSNLTVRPGCTNCPARCYKSGADITIADCWGFNKNHPDMNDDRGMSLALLHTSKGIQLYNSVLSQLDSLQIPYVEVEEKGNHSPIILSPKFHPYRSLFFRDYTKGKKETIFLLNKYVRKKEKKEQRISRIKQIVKSLLGEKLIRIIKSK